MPRFAWPAGGISHRDPAVGEEVAAVADDALQQGHEVDEDVFPAVAPALDPGEVEDAVDGVGQPFRVLDHEPDVFDLVLPGQLVFQEGLQVELEGGHRRLQLVGEIGDEVVLEAIELEGLLVVDENHENADGSSQSAEQG